MHNLITIFDLIIVALFFIFAILFSLSVFNWIRYKVPQVWTFSSDFKIMKKYLKKYNLAWKSLVDLWSWSWKVLRFFEKQFWMKTTWYEIDFSNVIIAKIINLLVWSKAKVIKWNYLKADLSKFDVVYVYWFTVLMPGIEKKLWENCKEWTLVIANAFKMPNKKTVEVLVNEKWKEEVFVYEIENKINYISHSEKLEKELLLAVNENDIKS